MTATMFKTAAGGGIVLRGASDEQAEACAVGMAGATGLRYERLTVAGEAAGNVHVIAPISAAVDVHGCVDCGDLTVEAGACPRCKSPRLVRISCAASPVAAPAACA